ncbi:hypothetical protein LCGC14_2752520 [marine sediment metagenome]|uniref:Glycosyltransferase family 25 protein n=2 Tax=root TaxID=1 RepID=A0A831VYD3_9GAMM|nr:glycosyltransferase family 25 protein [Marinobacter antarcticus]HEA52666.1 glycosyltransferase family 25 protein [Marinobacter antarcticus]
MKIYVINLPCSSRRLRKMKQRLSSFDLKYEVIQAISAADIEPGIVEKINNSDPRGGALKPGEVACARSHSKALRKMLDDEEEVGIIIEDDVVFDSKFCKIVKSISASNLENGPLLLCALFFRPTKITKSDYIYEGSYHYLVDQIENVWGTMAYAIKRMDAERMSVEMFSTRCRADDWEHYINEGIIDNITLCFPFPVRHEELNSDIAKFSKFSNILSISGFSKFIHKYRIFPFFQISIIKRQARAEKRHSNNLIVKNGEQRKIYQLK